jgi:pimeloyl-ACP methyl ester carboxylesterase
VGVGGSVDNEHMQTILVPPLMCSASVYAPIIDTVWRRGAVTVADTHTDATVSDMASRLLGDAPERFALLGTSMGGYVALEVVRQAPDRVAGLVLVSTSARADTPEELASRARQSQLVEDGQFERLVDAAFAAVVAQQHENDQELLDEWRAMTRAVGAEVFLRQQRAVMGRADSRASLLTVGCPAVVIHGADDRLIPLAMGQEIASAIPGAELVTIEDAGHFLFREQPGAARAAVAEFLDRVDLGR